MGLWVVGGTVDTKQPRPLPFLSPRGEYYLELNLVSSPHLLHFHVDLFAHQTIYFLETKIDVTLLFMSSTSLFSVFSEIFVVPLRLAKIWSATPFSVCALSCLIYFFRLHLKSFNSRLITTNIVSRLLVWLIYTHRRTTVIFDIGERT